MSANKNIPYENDPSKISHIKDVETRKRVVGLCKRTTELAMRANGAFSLGRIEEARQLRREYHLGMAELMRIRPPVDAASAARQEAEIERHQALAGSKAAVAA